MRTGGEHARLRRAVGLTTVTGLLVGAAVLHQVGDRASTTPTTASPRPPAPSSPGWSPVRPPRPLPQNGPGVTEPGVLLVAHPTTEGTLDVGEWVVLPRATDRIELAPPQIEAAKSAFTGLAPEISSLRVTVDERPVPAPEGRLTGEAGATTVELRQPARAYVLRYFLHDAVVRSRPESAGRVLAAYAPASQGLPPDLPVAIAAYGGAVRKMWCPLGPTPSEPCSTGRPPVRRVDADLRPDTALVYLKADLEQ